MQKLVNWSRPGNRSFGVLSRGTRFGRIIAPKIGSMIHSAQLRLIRCLHEESRKKLTHFSATLRKALDLKRLMCIV
jgi:hypothetical protein